MLVAIEEDELPSSRPREGSRNGSPWPIGYLSPSILPSRCRRDPRERLSDEIVPTCRFPIPLIGRDSSRSAVTWRLFAHHPALQTQNLLSIRKHGLAISHVQSGESTGRPSLHPPADHRSRAVRSPTGVANVQDSVIRSVFMTFFTTLLLSSILWHVCNMRMIRCGPVPHFFGRIWDLEQHGRVPLPTSIPKGRSPTILRTRGKKVIDHVSAARQGH